MMRVYPSEFQTGPLRSRSLLIRCPEMRFHDDNVFVMSAGSEKEPTTT